MPIRSQVEILDLLWILVEICQCVPAKLLLPECFAAAGSFPIATCHILEMGSGKIGLHCYIKREHFKENTETTIKIVPKWFQNGPCPQDYSYFNNSMHSMPYLPCWEWAGPGFTTWHLSKIGPHIHYHPPNHLPSVLANTVVPLMSTRGFVQQNLRVAQAPTGCPRPANKPTKGGGF